MLFRARGENKSTGQRAAAVRSPYTRLGMSSRWHAVGPAEASFSHQVSNSGGRFYSCLFVFSFRPPPRRRRRRDKTPRNAIHAYADTVVNPRLRRRPETLFAACIVREVYEFTRVAIVFFSFLSFSPPTPFSFRNPRRTALQTNRNIRSLYEIDS